MRFKLKIPRHRAKYSGSKEVERKSPPPRMGTVEELEHDFVEFLAPQIPADVARREFAVLWDESNGALLEQVGNAQDDQYTSLLTAMHARYLARYGDPADGGSGRGGS